MSADPLIGGKRKKKSSTSVTQDSKHLKSVTRFFNKLSNIKNAARLITCEFDEQLLQLSGFLGALTPRLERGWQTCTIATHGQSPLEVENNVATQLPPLIKPMCPGQSGSSGSVPLSYSFTWTRFRPQLCDESGSNVILGSSVEPEVMLLLNDKQIKQLTQNGRSESSALSSFGSRLEQLGRPVTCILFTNAKLRTFAKRRSSLGTSTNRLSINELCTELQLTYNVRATRVCSTVEDVALIIATYTASIAERPFKEGRLLRDQGLSFLPETVRKGLSGCASLGRGAGPSPSVTGDADRDSQALQSWANRVWLAQLGQWRGLTGEIAHAISLSYPTAASFFHAIKQCQQTSNAGDVDPRSASTSHQSPHPMIAKLAELEIRRGAGVLATRRRLGPELARRLVTLFTSDDPDEIVD